MKDLMNIPRNALRNISNFLDLATLLKFRKINKNLKRIVDYQLEFRTTKVCALNIPHFTATGYTPVHQRTTYDIFIKLSSERECALWKLFLISEIGFYEMNKINFGPFPRNHGHRSEFRLILKSEEEVRSILEKFANRIHGRVFESVHLSGVGSETCKACSGILDGNTVRKLVFGSKLPLKKDFGHWIDKVRKWKVYQVNISYFPMDKETAKFVLQIADEIEKLVCMFMIPFASVSLIKEIMKRKIYHLKIIVDSFSDFFLYSLNEVENLILFFNNSGKKLRLMLWTDIAPIVAQIGMFKLTARLGLPTEIVHLEMTDY